MDPKEQVKQLNAQLEQKQNEINSYAEQVKTLGAFKAEAMNGREKIASLEVKAADMERQLGVAVKQASDAASSASAAGTSAAVSAKKVSAAEDMAKAIKVLLGS